MERRLVVSDFLSLINPSLILNSQFKMPTLWITSRGTEAKISSERITVAPITSDSDLSGRRDVPLFDVDLVVIGQGVITSNHLISRLLSRNIPIFFLDGIGRVKGQFLPSIPAHGKFRLAQYETSRSSEKQTQVASALIDAKIFNQRRSLQRLSLSREVVAATITHHNFGVALKKLANEHPDLGQILGIEGFASADFYSVWGRFLPEEFPFERRTRRPPHNPVNACLSFISTVLYQEMVTACFAAGLDPALGCLHATENDRWSLALDLMEPLRPVIVEALTLDLFSRNILDSSHFEPQNGGIYLDHEGRNKLILQYEKRMERHFHSNHLNHRTTLRLVLRNLPLLFKKYISEGVPMTPFKMN